MSYVTGDTIRQLREQKKMTQKQLADQLGVSDKTVSKWETNRGLPDIGFIGSLANCLGVSITELLVGEVANNRNQSGNMKKMKFYVCPVCGNVIQAVGEGAYSCCGVLLPVAEVEEESKDHAIQVEVIDNEYYVHMNHSMIKEHYISFLAYVTSNQIQMIKLYPEQNVECRFARRGHGMIYGYCNKHGLFQLYI